MRNRLFKLCTLLIVLFSCSEIFSQSNPLYTLPEKGYKKVKEKDLPYLAGTDDGLYRIISKGKNQLLWSEGKVHQIVKTSSGFWLSTSKGIIFSEDLKTFTEKNNGLPFLTIKTYENKEKKLEQQAALLKDLCADPLDPDILVTATKDEVYLTRDGGETWKSIGSMSKNSSGMKAVAVSHIPVYASDGSISSSEVVVFMSHPIYGFSYYRADLPNPKWTDVSAGFSAMQSLTQIDEIADILPVLYKTQDGTIYAEIYLTQTFLPNIYRFDWKSKKAVKVYQGTEACDTFDGLCQNNGHIVFSSMGKLQSFSLAANELSDLGGEYKNWVNSIFSTGSILNCAYIPEAISGFDAPLQLSELWLLDPNSSLSPWDSKATGKKAIYTSVYQMRNMDGIEKYRKIIRENNLNALVVDMKDDYGLLRFEPKNEMLREKGKVTQYKVDLDKFIEEYKKDGTYLIARIVVFKDKNLASYGGGKYAVWDSVNKKPWVGTKGTEDVLDEEGNVTGSVMTYYDENWVDPYSEEVWEYNVEIAKELIERGFDEIQFDYIRFPTDGLNLGRATYRWKDKGMDKESALISFLNYARQNINAPIGIDIYGANGWYRTGARTGQDVELMSEYVDVICPMYYPSHFEQDFLEYKPVVERPYRIYFYGSYRNSVIGRNRVIVRPWVQAFYMGVRYDRAYYNKDYVQREIFGVRDGLNRGYMYWNNSGGYYEDISPDPDDSQESPWKENESNLQHRLPAFSSDSEPIVSYAPTLEELKKQQADIVMILNTVLDQEWDDDLKNVEKRHSRNSTHNFLYLEPFGNYHD
ncbi:MAG: putative glycoside hydrolase [Treponema sp.]|nr:putative glycoside hydrolase [Treponema sp.]